MITQLLLKSSSSPGRPPLQIETPPSVTIFVGPNNAGKSQALREVFAFCLSGDVNAVRFIIDKLMFEEVPNAEAYLGSIKTSPNLGESVPPGHSFVNLGGQRQLVTDNMCLQALRSPNANTPYFAQIYLRYIVLNLDGPNRIALVNPQQRGDLKKPTLPLARLLTDDSKRAALRKTIYEAVNLYFAIDMSEGDQLAIRFGLTEPPDERAVHDETLEYMRSARAVHEVSDGVKAYTGILLQLSAGDPRIIIIDEPEAFLHPSLALNLGKELAKAAATEGRHIFAATHSPQFVMGAILSGAKVNIIRLTYEGGIGAARLLPSGELTKLMQDPLLRSVGVLAGLFYNHVIVTEADAGRAFYQEINERLIADDDSRGALHTLFLNADNKQTIPRIVEPLRKLGIPTAGIVDIDVLKDGGQEWTRHLEACNIPTNEHQPFGTRRKSILDALEATNPAFKTGGGIGVLSGGGRESAENLFNDLARYGLFVVPRGEVEAWLSGLNVPRAKGSWLRSIFEKMGNDPSLADYVKPGPGDVWDFINQIRTWLVDPKRRGIPV